MFQRGFKAWCENVSLRKRRELGIKENDPLDPEILAHHLGIKVWNVNQVPNLNPETLGTLLREGFNSWSAVTVCVDSKQAIILNSSHSEGRSASNLAHELSHVLLDHKPGRIDVSEDGVVMLSTYDKKQEEEASWLGGCLLLPREALLHIRRQRMNPHLVVSRYGVSLDMLKYRMRVTGISKQFSRFRP